MINYVIVDDFGVTLNPLLLAGQVHGGTMQGIGQALVKYAVLEALSIDLRKLVVEVIADHESTVAMFRSLGFEPEALLADHVRDQAGELHDLMVLVHSVDDSYAALASVGVGDAI